MPATSALILPIRTRTSVSSDEIDALLETCEQQRFRNPGRLLQYAAQAETIARKTRRKSRQAAALRYKGIALLYLGQRDKSLAALKKGLEIYSNRADHKGIAETLCSMAKAFTFFGAPDQAREALTEAETHHLKTSCVITERMLVAEWSSYYRTQGEVEKTLQYTGRLLRASILTEDQAGIAAAHETFGFISLRLGEGEKAMEHYRTALEICRLEGLSGLEFGILCEMTYFHLNVGNGNIALELAHRAESIAAEMESEYAMIRAAQMLCKAYSTLGNHPQAIERSADLTHRVRKFPSTPVTIEAFLIRADTYRAAGRFATALRWYNRALTAAGQLGSLPYTMQACGGLATVYEELEDLPAATRYHREYLAANEKLMGFAALKAAASAAAAAELERATAQQERLHNKIRLLEAELQRQRTELATASLHITESSQMAAELQEKLRTVRKMAPEQSSRALSSIIASLGNRCSPLQAWEEFSRQLQAADPDFSKALAARCKMLTPTELKICSLLRINLSTKEIAAFLAVQPSTIDFHRWAIRKKLNLSRNINLALFLRGI